MLGQKSSGSRRPGGLVPRPPWELHLAGAVEKLPREVGMRDESVEVSAADAGEGGGRLVEPVGDPDDLGDVAQLRSADRDDAPGERRVDGVAPGVEQNAREVGVNAR